MSKIKFSEKYIDGVFSPIQKSGKMAASVLMFKDGASDDVVITSYDTAGTCKICIKTKEDNVSFDDTELGIFELSDLTRYINLINYPSSETASIDRIEASTTRGVSYDCLDFSGSIGKFIMPVAYEESFDNRVNRSIIPNQGTPSTDTQIMRFVLTKEELKSLANIGKQLGVRHVNISIGNDSTLMHFKGNGNNQYTKKIDNSLFVLHSIGTSADESPIYYPQDSSYEKYLPFSFELFDYSNGFGVDFTYELIRTTNGLYAIYGYGKTVADDATVQSPTSDVRYTLLTATNPRTSLAGTDDDVFIQ